MTSPHDPPSIPLREILACEVTSEEGRVVIAFVRREGMRFQLLSLTKDDEAAIVRDPRTLKYLERVFELPVRVLDGAEAVFLGVQTVLAEREGREFYHLKVGKNSPKSGMALTQRG